MSNEKHDGRDSPYEGTTTRPDAGAPTTERFMDEAIRKDREARTGEGGLGSVAGPAQPEADPKRERRLP
jgi:hypothetical protein